MFKDIFNSQDSYFRWRVEKVKRIAERFPEVFMNLKGNKVLDIGCGAEAPLSYYLSNHGAIVYSGDIDNKTINSAEKFAPKSNFSVFNAEKLPFKDEEFDFVFGLDILEHVSNPEKVIKEALRVTKPNGMIFFEYLQYYAYPTGSHLYGIGLKGFLPFQIMPKKWTRHIIFNSELNTKDTPDYLFNQFVTLNKITVSRVNKILRRNNAQKLHESFYLSLPHGELNVSFLKYVPLIREIIPANHSFVLKKGENNDRM